MAELSPAAQAVLIAEAKSRCLREERGCHPNDQDWNGCYVCVHRRGLAAALRAAALHIYSDEYETCGGASYALMIDVDDLLAIAAELEAQ